MARVLVIDDDLSVCRTIKTILEYANHSVALADNGPTAASALLGSSFDVAIVDIFMPDIDGIEIIRLIAEHAPQMRIIAISGAAFAGAGGPPGPGSEFFNRALDRGATYCLQKPFGAGELLALVDACCGSRGPTTKVA